MAGGLWTNGCVPGPGYTGLPLLLEPQPWVGRGHWEPRWEVVPPAQPSPAQGCEAETQAGSWKSRHGRAAGLLGLKHGCEKRIWRDSPASVGQVELVSAGLSRGTS